jgi:hypothetical protein
MFKFFQKYGVYFLVILIVSEAFYRPPLEYDIRLTPQGVNLLYQAVNGPNSIPGEQRVQLLQAIQTQIIEQDNNWKADSIRRAKK